MNELLKELVTIVSDTKTFISGQLPDVAEQILKFKFISSVVSLLTSFVLIVSSVLVITLSVNPGENNDLYCVKMIISIIVGIFSSLALYCSIMECLQIKIAPKLFLIEYVSDLAKPKEKE